MSLQMRPLFVSALALTAATALSGCRSTGELVADQGVGITAVRSVCPAVGIADYTGDITTFRSPDTTDAAAIDITAAMTEVRGACDEKATPVDSQVSFRVVARRADARGARDVTLPYFVTVVRGTNVVIAKRVAQVTLHFADGQARAEAVGSGHGVIDRQEATIDRNAQSRITKVRRAGEADAAIDPMNDPEVKAAIARSTFEVLVGFQLTAAQLQYNATR
jgi:hypothetical protein